MTNLCYGRDGSMRVFMQFCIVLPDCDNQVDLKNDWNNSAVPPLSEISDMDCKAFGGYETTLHDRA